ncbi:MAG: DUF5103 domain-containing protein [Candidatus Amulumruptor caecigallinarius]|nr:DUF5103 domain-containing protein [Candidatus Amulumruptor caecigallinarius]
MVNYLFKISGLVLMTLTAGVLAAFAQGVDTAEKIFNPRFRTLKTQVADNFFSPPVIRMNSDDRLVVTFDEIGEENSFLEYRLIHCNSDWTPSRLVEADYIDGFNAFRIEDFAFSELTYVHYVNYRVEIPNEECRILHSGNYLLQVYNPDSPDELILQTRFRVSEHITSISGMANSRTDRGHNTEWQQLSLAVNHEALPMLNPYQDIKVEIMQNQRESTRRMLASPVRVSEKTAVYEHTPDMIFPASNEYRRFESTSNNFPGMHVDSLRFMGSNYHVWLKPDFERATSEYNYDRTQNGRYIVREYNATDSDIAADYITVHFNLDFPELINADIYVDGEFTHNQFNDFNRMEYDRDTHTYRAEIPLKQGNYNYQYVALARDGKTQPNVALVEGNKYETDNEYDIAVYFRPPGARGDRLIGFAIIHPI